MAKSMEHQMYLGEIYLYMYMFAYVCLGEGREGWWCM